MYLALGPPGATSNDAAVYVALLSVANCFGRLIVGGSSRQLEHIVPRPLILLVTTFIMGLSMLYLAFSSLPMLYFGCVITGLAYGSYWALLPSITSDLFGHSSMGANYNFLSFAT